MSASEGFGLLKKYLGTGSCPFFCVFGLSRVFPCSTLEELNYILRYGTSGRAACLDSGFGLTGSRIDACQGLRSRNSIVLKMCRAGGFT